MDNSIHSVVSCANYYGLFSLDEIEAESKASKVALFTTDTGTDCCCSFWGGGSDGAIYILYIYRRMPATLALVICMIFSGMTQKPR